MQINPHLVGRVKTFETLNMTQNSLSFVLQEQFSSYRADLKRARLGGSDSDNKANLSPIN